VKRAGGKLSRASIALVATCGALAAAAPATTTAGPPLAQLHTPAAMAATVHQLRACLSSLVHTDQRLLTLRFGLGGKPVLTDAQVAARLGLTPAQVTGRVIVAVRRLAVAHHFGGCRTRSTVATAASSSSLAPPRPATLAPLAAHHSGGGGIAVAELVAIVAIVACVLVIGREFRKILFPPLPR
jgi:hypothetical protein